MLISFIGFIFFSIINLLFIQPLSSFNSYSYALGGLIIVIYCLLGFHDIIDKLPSNNLFELKEFWMGAGTLVYFGSCFFIFISYHYLSVVSEKNVGTLWMLHNLFLTAGCLLYSITFIKRKWILE